MSKLSQDVPAEQRQFFKHFEKIAYRHQYSEVFDDYLTMLINFFAHGEQQQWRDQALHKYTDDEKQEMNAMFQSHIMLINEMIVNRNKKWYDSLGDIYQTITSKWKASGMGQFFTPQSVVDMMAKITFGDDCKPYSMVAEPAAGSGRMVLAAHSIQPLNYYHCTDADSICAKMTAINMCFHNCAGLVTHGNSLSGQNHRHYIITRIEASENVFVPFLKVIQEDKQAFEHLNVLSEYCGIMRKKIIAEEHISIKNESNDIFVNP